jgi:hypothetical protein
MKKYKIITTTDCYSEYIVEANNKKDAEDTFWNGDYISERDIDFRNEEIEEVEEIKEEAREYSVDVTQSTVYNMVKKYKDTLSYTRQYIQEYQIDDEEGDRIATLELYYTDDGYIYDIIYTNELNGESKEFSGQEADELAIKLLEGETPLIDTI